MNKPDEFLKNMLDEGKVINDESKFHIHNRIDSWQKQAPNYQDRDLDKLKTAMLNVFMEEDPQYELAKNNRMFAKVQGKKLRYSAELRRGLAISLALVGNYNDLLTNCSEDKRKGFVAEVLHNVFANISWKRIATLDSVLPFFAEADPDIFLAEVEKLVANEKVIKDLIADEGEIFQGGFHWSGIVYALETLLWSTEYFSKTVEVLAKLAEVDKGGNVHPRPHDALLNAFIPLYPQTTVTTEHLAATAQFIADKHPQLSWNVLTKILGQLSFSNRREPEVRKELMPHLQSKQRKVLPETYDIYRNILLNMAENSIEYAEKLLQIFNEFSLSPYFERTLQIFSSSMIQNTKDEVKERIWSGLKKICILYRREKFTRWKQSKDKILEIEKVIAVIQPTSIYWCKKTLFNQNQWGWHETDDYQAEESKFLRYQDEAVREIVSEHGFSGIFNFSKIVEMPEQLGMAVKRSGLTIDKETIRLVLIIGKEKCCRFVGGYLRQCFVDDGEIWLNKFEIEKWSDEEKAMFLVYLPYTSQVIHFAAKWLNDESKYWEAFDGVCTHLQNDYEFVIAKTLKYNRSDLAIESIALALHRKTEIPFSMCIDALNQLPASNRIKQMARWDIIQIIENLQERIETDTERVQLIQVEFLYLPLLSSSDSRNSSKTLNEAMAEDPAFFHRIISSAFLPEDKVRKQDIDENLAKNAFALLYHWKNVPGVDRNGDFNYQTFMHWYEQVMEYSKQSGHSKVAQLNIGKILFYVPSSEKLWINQDIAALLNEDDNKNLREGYYLESINSRGVRIVDFSGDDDYKLAAEYDKKAKELEALGLVNFAQTLKYLAQNSKADAERCIADGQKRLEDEEL